MARKSQIGKSNQRSVRIYLTHCFCFSFSYFKNLDFLVFVIKPSSKDQNPKLNQLIILWVEWNITKTVTNKNHQQYVI